MYKKMRQVATGKTNKAGKPVYGMQRVWECPKCGRRYRDGSEIIRMKPQRELSCFGKDEEKCRKCTKNCENKDRSIAEFQRKQVEKETKVTKKKKQGLNRRPPIKIVKKDAK
jgi:hypothetical protein